MHRIRNPLAGISKPDLLADVTAFCNKHGLEDKISVFQKGALVAQHPESFEDIEELDEDDKIPIRREKTRKLSAVVDDASSKVKSRQMAFALGLVLQCRCLLAWLSHSVLL
jgi:hypothetical protein